MSTAAAVTAVCVVAELHPEQSNPDGLTGIDKRPVGRAVPVGPYGLGGDLVKDYRHHGGLAQAVYAYADEDAARWSEDLGVEIRPGMFGENLRTNGVDLNSVEVGRRLRIGASGLELELTSPRIPCATFARRMAKFGVPERGWVKRFTQHGVSGAYFAVISTGDVATSDTIELGPSPGHGVTLGEMFTGGPEVFARLLHAEDDGRITLQEKVRDHARRAAARG